MPEPVVTDSRPQGEKLHNRDFEECNIGLLFLRDSDREGSGLVITLLVGHDEYDEVMVCMECQTTMSLCETRKFVLGRR